MSETMVARPSRNGHGPHAGPGPCPVPLAKKVEDGDEEAKVFQPMTVSVLYLTSLTAWSAPAPVLGGRHEPPGERPEPES